MTADWEHIARERMLGKRDQLMAKGHPQGAADGAIDWARGMAERDANPTRDPSGFLRRLDHWLGRCEQWATGVERWARS